VTGPLAPLIGLYNDLEAERWRQLKTWGAQSHPDGTGHPGDRALADFYRKLCDAQFEHGEGTWRHILAEEVAEAFAESERPLLRKELIEVATVALAWVQDLDERAGDREPRVPTRLPSLAGTNIDPGIASSRTLVRT
jgi:hypothetical protein